MTEPEGPHIIAGESAVLARRYAHALLELAEERGQIDSVAGELRLFRNAVKDNADFRKLVRNPRLTRAQLAETMKALAVKLELGDIASSFLLLLARKRRLAQVEDIIGVFLNELAGKRGEHVIEVYSPRPVSDGQKKQLTEKLEKITGGKVALLVREAPDLLGGLVIKWGSRLLDASLKGKLGRIEREMKSRKEAA
jgi:F-type H+-transporting ATPase subunit delta